MRSIPFCMRGVFFFFDHNYLVCIQPSFPLSPNFKQIDTAVSDLLVAGTRRALKISVTSLKPHWPFLLFTLLGWDLLYFTFLHILPVSVIHSSLFTCYATVLIVVCVLATVVHSPPFTPWQITLDKCAKPFFFFLYENKGLCVITPLLTHSYSPNPIWLIVVFFFLIW